MNRISTKSIPVLVVVAMLAGLFGAGTRKAQALSSNIVISQVYGGGGNTGAAYKNDYIELFNRGTSEVSIEGWSVQYASASGSSWSKTDLSGTIQPGQYYLIQEAAGSGGTIDLPTPDAIGSIGMSGTSGKVALVNNSQTPLSGTCPGGGVDLVGYGTANCYETAATPALTNTSAAKRNSNGCAETDNNSTDFTNADPTIAPTPRNTSSPFNPCASDDAPYVDSISPLNGAASVPVDTDILVAFSEDVTLAGDWFDLSCTVGGADLAAAVSGGPSAYTIDPNSDLSASEDCTLTIRAAQVQDADAVDPPDTMAADFVSTFSTQAACDQPFTPIYAIQGSGDTAAISGPVTVEGIVIADEEGASPALRGFYLQDSNGDDNPATSDGIFVFNGDNDNVSLGDIVRVSGTAEEYQGQTQIGAVTAVVACGAGALTPTDISLPFASAAEPEQYEGMLVRFTQTLTVTEHYLLGRFGQVTLSGGTGRLYQPTNIVSPGAAALAMQAANDLNKIILDDASQAQNPDPILFGRGGLPLSASNTLRGGDTITGLVGVFTYTWGGDSDSPDAYRVRPINALGGGIPNFVAANGRPSAPDPVGGTVKVAGMNLLNYFNTFGAGACSNGTLGSATDCRGAEGAAEFARQSDKTVNAILAMNVDVIGIVEIENDGYGPNSAIQNLVDKLNTVAGAGTYAFINADDRTGKIDALGADAIKVGFLYKPATITPVGATAVLDTAAFVNGGDSTARNRVSLLQAFQTTTGERFIVNINHFKSKGSACDDPDIGDGQGNCAIVRTNAAMELKNWIATNPTGTGDPDVVILGDLNSYTMEDPIAELEAPGYYTNMVKFFDDTTAYSYVFDGQWGALDYALGSASLLTQVSGVTEFHINADEPSVLDYNTNYKTADQIISLYSRDPFRASDHDPIIVGLNLDATAPILTVPANMIVEAASAAGKVINFSATATDAIDPAPVVACIPPSGSAFPLGTTTVNCTAADNESNVTNGSFTVTVQDTTDPLLTLPANMTVQATSAAGRIVTFSVTAADLVDAAPTVSCIPPSGSTFPPGITTVNCAATDNAGNVANGSFTITVTAPAVSLSATKHNFGYQAVGTTSGAFAFTVTNTGTANLVIGTLGITGQFALSNNLCNGKTLAPSGACTFGAAFSPTSTGAKTGSISIPSNAASSPNRVSLSGNGHTTLTATFTSLGIYDGYIIESAETTGAGGTANAPGGIMMVGEHFLDRQVRSLLHFDTESLPDDAVVTGLLIKIKQQGFLWINPFATLGNLQVDIAKPFFGEGNALEPSDFQAAPRESNVGFFNPIPATGNWYSASLDPAAFPFLNRRGNTQFRLAFHLEDDNDRRTDLCLFYSGDFRLAAYRPVLIVTYYVP